MWRGRGARHAPAAAMRTGGRQSGARRRLSSFESVESTVVSLKMLVLSRGPCNAMHRALS